MQAQDINQQQSLHQQGADQVCNSMSSIQAVRTVISTSIASILYSRGLVPDECVSNKPIMHRRADAGPSATTMQMRNLVKGSSAAADQIIEIRDGAFDALDKGFLRELTLAVYMDQNDPTNIIESYTFGISYERSPESDQMQPVLNITERLQHFSLADNVPPSVKHYPTVRDVKNSVRNLIKHLVLSMDTFHALPRRCFVNFKLLYTDNTPDSYEPKGFSAGDPAHEKYYLKTHNHGERPDVTFFKPVNTGHHAIQVSSASISRFLPNIETASPEIQSPTSPSDRVEHEHQIHLADAKTRLFEWTEEDFVKLHAEEQQEMMPRADETKVGTGLEMEVDARSLQAEEKATQEESVQGESTPNWMGRPEPMRRLASVAQSTMDLEDHVQATQILETQKNLQTTRLFLDNSQMTDRDAIGSPELSQKPHPVPVASFISSSSSEELVTDCACGVTQASEGQIQCDTCNKWFHRWCMGFHENDQRLEENTFKCFECCLAKSPVLLARKDVLTNARTAFSDLVLFRRALQLAKIYQPKNMSSLKNILYAPGNGYKTTWKRLENEGFVKNKGIGRKSAWTFTAKMHGPCFDHYFGPESGNVLLPGFNDPAAAALPGSSKIAAPPSLKRQHSGGMIPPAKRVKFSHIQGGIELRGSGGGGGL